MRPDRGLVCWLPFFMMPLFLIAGGCKQQYSLKSTWLDKKITIDGTYKDWKDNRWYIDEKSNTRISIYNDNDNLYICLNSMDPGIQMSIERRGLSVWLCKTGTSEKVWGLRHPHMAQSLEGDAGFDGFDEPGEYDNEQQNQPIQEAIKFLFFASEKEPGKIFSPDEIGDFGIFCGFSRNKGIGMVYEIKIPLNRSEKTPYAAGQSPKKIVSIGFITEKVPGERSRKKDGIGRGGMDGGGPGRGVMAGGGPDRGGPGGGMGGGMGGGPGMGRGPMGGPRAEVLEIWANIELSAIPALNKT